MPLALFQSRQHTFRLAATLPAERHVECLGTEHFGQQTLIAFRAAIGSVGPLPVHHRTRSMSPAAYAPRALNGFATG